VRLNAGQIVYGVDGKAYRISSTLKIAGECAFKLADLQGRPCSTPANFSPIAGAWMHFASLLKFAFNKDLTAIVNSLIEQAGLPTDPKMDWAKYLTKIYSSILNSVTQDQDIQDEVIYRAVVSLLFERTQKNGKKLLENFAEKVKGFDKETQKKPIAEQVSSYLKSTFIYYAKDHAKQDAIALIRPEEMSMEQPGEEGETYNILDTEEHATTPGVGQSESDRDINQFIEKFEAWVKTKETPKSAPNYAALLKIYWDQAQQTESGDVKISDLTQEWIHRTGLSFDSLKQYRDKIGGLLRDFVYENKTQLGNSYQLADLLQHMFPPPPKAKARPAKASSEKVKFKAAGCIASEYCPQCGNDENGCYCPNKADLLDGETRGDKTASNHHRKQVCKCGSVQTCRCSAPKIAFNVNSCSNCRTAAEKPKCPHCGSDDYGLMPTDFETAKCNACGKNWEHGIVKGINDPKEAAYGHADRPINEEQTKLEQDVDRFSKELKKFPKGPTGMTPDATKATPEWQAAKRNYDTAFQALRNYNSKHTAADLGRCSCEWEECPLGHKAGGCPNPAAHMLEIYGYKTRYCQPCTDATIEYIRLEQGTGDADNTVKILSSVQEPYCDGCDRLKKNCICEGCDCPENKNASKYGDKIKKMEARRGESIDETLKKADGEEQPTLQKLPSEGGFKPIAAGPQYAAPGLRVVLAEDWFIYVTDETTEHMWVYNTEMWYEWGEIPNAFGEDTTKPQPTVEAMIPYAKGHTPQPVMKDDGQQLTLQEFETEGAEWTDPGFEKEGMIGHDFVNADQDAIRPSITPGDTGRLPHGRTQGSKEAAELAGRGGGSDDVRGAGDLWREEFYQEGGSAGAPPKIATSLKTLECCGSVTNHHKIDCPQKEKVWNDTLGKLYPSGTAGPKVAGKWKVLLRDPKGQQREQQVSGVDYGSAERAVKKYMKEGEKVVSMTIARKTAAPAAAAPAARPAAPAAAPQTVVAPPPGTAVALPGQQPTTEDEKPMRKTVVPELPGKKWHMTSKTASILEDAFEYFMEGKKEGGLADVFNERYTRTGKGEDKYIACSKLMMDFEYAFRREEDGSLSDIDDYREDAENALREIVGDDPNYTEQGHTERSSGGVTETPNKVSAGLLTEQNTPEMEARVAQLAQTHPETEIHENCNPYFEHGQWWIVCGPCGATWSVVDVGHHMGDEGDLDLEQIDNGDDSCQENFHESSTLPIPSSLATKAENVIEASIEKEADGARLTNISTHDLDTDTDGHCKRCGMSMQEASKAPCAKTGSAKKAWLDEEETSEIQGRLEYLRGELRAERISQGELMELQGLADYIDPGDVELLEAAGVEEVIPQPDVPIETPEFGEADKTRLRGLGVIGKKKKAFEPGANSGIRGSNDGTYIYQADVWCEKCATEIAATLDAEGKTPPNVMDEASYDSDNYPKGPFFEEESDAPEHCSGCHIFLENPLTTDGQTYMQSMVDEALAKGRGDEPHIKEWMDFYGYHPEEKDMQEHESSDASDKINAMPQRGGKLKTPAQLGLTEKSDLDLANEGIPPRHSSEDKVAATEQPTSGEDEGFNVKVVYNKYGITLEPTANLLSDVQGIGEMINKPNIFELMEDFFTNGWEMVNPEDIGALTSGELMSDQDGNVYWHERYQIEDMVEELMNGNKVNLQYGGNLFEMDEGSEIAPPAEPDPNQMDLPLQSSAEDTDYKDWQYEVANGDTKLNFEDWKMYKEEADKFSPTSSSEDTDHKDWQYEVANGDTKLNFEQWKEHKREADSFGPNKKEATGEMSQSEADDAEAWPMHHAIAKALGGTVKAFDQYQGPYVLVGSEIRGQGTYAPAIPMKGTVRLWIQATEGGDGAELQVYNEDNQKLSEPFWWEDTNAAVDAAMSVLDQPAAKAKQPKPPAKRKGSEEKQAAPGDGGLQRDVQNQYENHPLIEMLWGSLKRDPSNKDRVQTAWGTKTKQGLVLSVARAMKETPVSGE